MSLQYAALQTAKIRGHIIGLGFKTTNAAEKILTEAIDFVECQKCPDNITHSQRLLNIAVKEKFNCENECHALDRIANQVKCAIPHLIDLPE